MAHFIGLFGAIEEAQNALSCKNGLGDGQVGKLTTATSHTLVKFLQWPVSLSTNLFGRNNNRSVSGPALFCVVSWYNRGNGSKTFGLTTTVTCSQTLCYITFINGV